MYLQWFIKELHCLIVLGLRHQINLRSFVDWRTFLHHCHLFLHVPTSYVTPDMNSSYCLNWLSKIMQRILLKPSHIFKYHSWNERCNKHELGINTNICKQTYSCLIRRVLQIVNDKCQKNQYFVGCQITFGLNASKWNKRFRLQYFLYLTWLFIAEDTKKSWIICIKVEQNKKLWTICVSWENHEYVKNVICQLLTTQPNK